MFTLGELARQVGCEVLGDPQTEIERVATLQNASKGAIGFLSNRRYRKFLHTTKASAVIISPEDQEYLGALSALLAKDPYLAYAKIARILNPDKQPQAGVHSSVVIGKDCDIHPSVSIAANCVLGDGVSLGAGVAIGPSCVIEDNVVVGDHTRLVAQAVIYHQCIIGQRCLLHAGVVIGSDGFGLANENGVWLKIPQVGRVCIGDDVEIGANTTVDRGAIEDTIIGDGVKLDNQIQIAHNVRIGDHTAIAACCGIAGSVSIGKHCAIGGKVGIVGHLEITDGVTVTAQSLVTHSIRKPGVYSSGTPLQENGLWQKNSVRFKQLDDIARRLKALENKIT